ncbi:ABC transporter permease [Rhizobium sophorae]|uniref:ABC transporter permease n=6 Tax=Rhizobiaceae TaxID=82115 RepID=A0A2S3YUE0_9HYPH|nr:MULTISPECIES: ABC transporter permease [Rhizobiaceae]AIC29643.1 sugar ABC transporter permease protein [Rhizobium sp. IE4771]OWO92848.1 ABC transporter permease [Rhizobium esperanzae]PCK84862.1 ABC transporter permease [Rhizobium sophoriradicis]PDT39281.1 ABC transporter permease [Sinorhizobium sp. FG01]PDT50783.1 ABC transporter permease [Sinorhizobium sp. NG07B]
MDLSMTTTDAKIETPSRTLTARRILSWVLGLPPAYYVLAILIAVAPAVSATLINPNYWFVILKQSAPLGIAVLAQSLVMRVRSIDLSVSGVFAFSIYLASSGLLNSYPPFVTVLMPIVIGLAVGLINGALVAYVRASAVIATLSVSAILIGIIQFMSSGRAPGSTPSWLRVLTSGNIYGLSYSVIVWIGISVLVALAFRFLILGRYFRAVGDNPRAAEITGIPLARTIFVSHTLAGTLTGIAALVQVSALAVGTIKPGFDTFMNALAATILGGVTFGVDRGGVAGPFVAVVAFSFLFAMLTVFGIQEPGKLIVQGGIIALAAIIYGARVGRV